MIAPLRFAGMTGPAYATEPSRGYHIPHVASPLGE
jgi:hypothetical protein